MLHRHSFEGVNGQDILNVKGTKEGSLSQRKTKFFAQPAALYRFVVYSTIVIYSFEQFLLWHSRKR